MKLIIGLGNPGQAYTGTRHNFGWQALDFLAEESEMSSRAQSRDLTTPAKILRLARNDKVTWQNEKKFRAQITKINFGGEDFLLAKPQTFYNLSGQSVQAIKSFYKLDNSDILVIHDDMDLPIGQLRTREKGSAAGNNGVQNIIDHIGADFARLRIGSGKAAAEHDGLTKPLENHRDYVLARPNSTEKAKFEQLSPEIERVAKDFIAGKFAAHSVKI